MLDLGGADGARHTELAESVGLAMARRARDILERHRAALTQPDGDAGPPRAGDPARLAADNAIFTAVLDAISGCLAQLAPGTPEDHWCDALVHLLLLARAPGMAGLPDC
jgi:hypothetical protein